MNGKRESHGSDYETDYLTDEIGRKADSFLDAYDQAAGEGEEGDARPPFLMVLSTPAPHAPFTPAPQYEDEYEDLRAPRTPSFNYVEESEGQPAKHWFVNSPPRPLNDTMLEYVDDDFRNRLRTMLSVDDLFDHVLSRLNTSGFLVGIVDAPLCQVQLWQDVTI